MNIRLIAKHLDRHVTLPIAHGHKSLDNFLDCGSLNADVLKIDVFEVTVRKFDPLVTPYEMTGCCVLFGAYFSADLL